MQANICLSDRIAVLLPRLGDFTWRPESPFLWTAVRPQRSIPRARMLGEHFAYTLGATAYVHGALEVPDRQSGFDDSRHFWCSWQLLCSVR